jgi:hypothetical protein
MYGNCMRNGAPSALPDIFDHVQVSIVRPRP